MRKLRKMRKGRRKKAPDIEDARGFLFTGMRWMETAARWGCTGWRNSHSDHRNAEKHGMGFGHILHQTVSGGIGSACKSIRRFCLWGPA